MLRLRQVNSEGEPIWRTSLESPHIGERLGFGSLEELFDFLRERTDLTPHTDSSAQVESPSEGTQS